MTNQPLNIYFDSNLVVRMGGLEPPRPKSPAPQAGASTNSATSAQN